MGGILKMALASDIIQKIQLGARRIVSTGGEFIGDATEFVRKNPVTSAVGVSGGILAGITAVQIVRKKRKATSKVKKPKRRVSKKKPTTRRKVSKKRKITKHHHRGKHRGTKAIHITKKGQPYIILPSGRARFIKKSSASRMRKLKGGFR